LIAAFATENGPIDPAGVEAKLAIMDAVDAERGRVAD
jgi:hypothetical protein